MLQQKKVQKTKIQLSVFRGMIRDKSQGPFPKAERVIIFYTPRNKPVGWKGIYCTAPPSLH